MPSVKQIEEFESILVEAHERGKAKSDPIPDNGCVGWAWVNLATNTPFGRFVKRRDGEQGFVWGRPSGTKISAHYHGQGIEGAKAYAQGVAEVLREHGIDCITQEKYD